MGQFSHISYRERDAFRKGRLAQPVEGGCWADREAAAVPPQNQQETKQASEKPAVVSALFTPRLGFCCRVGTRGQGTSSIPLSVAGHRSTHGKGHHPGLRHPQRRRAEPTQPGKPLEGPWASRMPLAWGMGPGRGFGVKETPLIFWQRQTGDLRRARRDRVWPRPFRRHRRRCVTLLCFHRVRAITAGRFSRRSTPYRGSSAALEVFHPAPHLN